jgi:phosphoglycerate dehydrogenase-like enzyme
VNRVRRNYHAHTFCGDTFQTARILLQRRLSPDADDEICVWIDRATPITIGNVDVLIPMMFRIDGDVMDAFRPRLIQQWGSGLEGIDLDAARDRKIPVASVPTMGSNADSVAEHAILLILALLRRLPEAQASVRAGVLGSPMGRILAGRTVCLYGLGSTALSLARRLRAFDVRLLGITRDPAATKVASFKLDACYSAIDRELALAQTDVLVVCVRLAQETRGLVDARALAALLSGAHLINVSRGAVVDCAALYHALADQHLGGAGLDVFWDEPVSPKDPLLALPTVIATPHVAGVTDGSYGEIADAVAANIEHIRRGKSVITPN